MSWKDRFTYQGQQYAEHEVGGNKMRFYPNRIGLLRELADLSKPIAKAVAQLFGDQRNDATAVTERFTEGGSQMEKITVEAVKPEVTAARRKERDAAIDALADALSDPRNRIMLGRLLMDSLRDEFPYKRDRGPAEVEEFLDGDKESYGGLDITQLKDLVVGWMKANSKVFGASGEQVAGLVKERLESLRSDSPSMAEGPATGDSSRTPSLQP